jgi:hypothetical protein
MPSISNRRDATFLQLQYITDSLGLRRTYLKDDVSIEDVSIDEKTVDNNVNITSTTELGNILKPIPTRNVDTVQRPDIEWYPSYAAYQVRMERLAKSPHSRPRTLPEGFLDQVSSPRVWTGSDFADPEKYLIHLSIADVTEIKSALGFFKGMFYPEANWFRRTKSTKAKYAKSIGLEGDKGPDAVLTETFPLPTLGGRLAEVA